MIKNHIFFKKKTFLIILPPPNITGEMHIGHFFQCFIIDLIIKFKILQNYKIKYIFGFDHAGISAYIKFKKISLIKKKKKYLKYIYIKQLKYIKFYIYKKKIEFTLNNLYEKKIKKYFFFFLKKKIIYIKKKILNFNKKIGIISDFEIKKKIFLKFFFFIKYKKKNSFLIIKTSNINSIIFNTFILFKNKLKKKLKCFSPIKIKINIYNDEFLKIKNFFIKITPNKNNFDFIYFFKKNEKILFFFKKYIYNYYISKKFIKTNKKIFFLKTIKKKILFEMLKKNNYIICIKKYISFKNFCKNYIIKNFLLDHWFLKIKKIFSIKKILKNIIIEPKKYFKFFFIWIKNISDWCISRDIIWGTKIPILIDNENNIFLKKNFRFIKYKNIKNVFDTWYNSSFWIIFSFYKCKKIPNIIVSGFDIIFYWIIKMLIMNVYFKKNTLIKKIIIHCLIKDKNKKKISKTTNNVICFKDIKKNINKLRINLIKNIFDEKIFFHFKNKKKFILKKINIIDDFFNIYNYYFNKKKFVIFFNKNVFFVKKKILKKNFLSKKAFILITKIYYPIKNYIKNNWNFIVNFFINKILIKNFFFIFKIKKKYIFIKKKNNLKYFYIFYKIKTIFYIKFLF